MVKAVHEEFNKDEVSPHEFCALLNKDKESLVRELKNDDIEYKVKDNEVYFDEESIIETFYNDRDYDPKSLEEAGIFRGLTTGNDWEKIKDRAREFSFPKLYEEVVGKQPIEDEEEFCRLCEDEVKSSGVCEKHYNTIYYRFKAVNNRTINKYANREQIQGGDSNWSRDYDSCRACNTTDKEHHAKGYCKTCYHERYRKKAMA